jgi:hypothetical protein
MKTFAMVLVLAVTALFALPHPSQAAGAIMGIPGYYDTTTSTFVPMVTPKVLPLTAPITRMGTVKVIITLNVEPAIGTDTPISCTASVSASDASFENSASATGLVSRTGTAGTLTILIPYNWTMVASGETAMLSVNCSESGGFSAGGIGRSVFFTAASFAVPATTTTTTKSFTASM